MRPERIWGLFLRALRVGLRGTANGRELCSDPRTNQLVFRGCRSGVRDGGPFLAPWRKARASLEAVTQSATEARLRVSYGRAQDEEGALEADSLRQSGSEAYRGRRIISSEGCTERRDTKAGNYDDSVDGYDGTKGENRNPGAGPEGAEPGFTREARGSGMFARARQPSRVMPRSSPSGGRVNRRACRHRARRSRARTNGLPGALRGWGGAQSAGFKRHGGKSNRCRRVAT